MKLKFISFALSLILLFSSLFFVNATYTVPSSTNNKISITEYDVETEQETVKTYDYDSELQNAMNLISELSSNGYSPEDLLQSSSSNLTSEYVHVTNTTVKPYSPIGFLKVKWKNLPLTYGYSTAFMVSKNVAVTAAHSIYSTKDASFIKSGQFYPGKNGFGVGNDPFGATYVKKMAVCTQYKEQGKKSNPQYDWGAVVLNDNIGDKCGYLTLAYKSMGDLLAKSVTIPGYPQYQSISTNYEQYKVVTNVHGIMDDETIYTHFNGIEGMSGSPLVYSDGTVCGIVSTKSVISTRVTDTVIYYINEYIEENK